MIKILRDQSLGAFACLLLTLCLIFTAAKAQKFTVDQKEATLPVIFDSIQKHTGFKYSGYFDDSLLKKKFPAGFHNYPLKRFLNKQLPFYGLTHYIDPKKPKTILLWLLDDPAAYAVKGQPFLHHIWGTVFSGDPGPKLELLANVNVEIKGTNRRTQTNGVGRFYFDVVPVNTVLCFTGVNLVSRDIKVKNENQEIPVKMEYRTDSLDEVVIYSNGFETKLKDSTTWTADVIPYSLSQRKPGSNVLNRIEYLSAGMSVNPIVQTNDGNEITNNVIVRTLSTLNAGSRPLFVVDNFPYYGNLNNINPEDIESITVLKDASSLSLWGVSAGNAVIVITTRKGAKDPNANPRIMFAGTLTYQGRPDVLNYHSVPAGELIDLEQQSYKRGYYSPDLLNDMNFMPVPPAVSLLYAADQGRITREEAAFSLAAMRTNDVRKDIERHLYQKSLEQQYTIQVSGGSGRLNYFASGGLTGLTGNLAGTTQQRRTTRVQLYYPFNKKLQLSAGVSYSYTTHINGNNPGYLPVSDHGGKFMPTYLSLMDARGNALPFYGDYKAGYMRHLDSIGFHSAAWYPLNDVNREINRLDTRDYVTNIGLQYTFGDRWRLDARYQIEYQSMNRNDLHSDSSYYTRDLTNIYTQWDPVTGGLFSPIPSGGVSDISKYSITARQARVQLGWQIRRDTVHVFSLLGGIDFRNIVTTGDTSRLYGVGGKTGLSPINDTIVYPSYMIGSSEPKTIPVYAGHRRTTDLLLSNFLNGTYTYKDRYTFSASLCGNVANLFGPSTNNKWQPLWSVGASWHLWREKFYKFDLFQELVIQASIGTLGNISRQATAYTTMATGYGGITGTPYATAYIVSPSDTGLAWEKVRIFNLGIDFATRRHILKGRIDLYSKQSFDLVAQTFLDPTLGGIQNPGSRAFYYANSAGLTAKGLDIDLTSCNLSGKLEWTTDVLFSIASSKVSKYSGPPGIGKDYLNTSFSNPVQGRPPLAIYAYKWLYLDGQNGDPVGTLNGGPDKDWNSIVNNTLLDSMVYKGPAQPPVFGAIRNTLKMGKLSLSWNISFKFGYFMRTPAFSSTDILNKWNSVDTYRQRWKKPGDERITNVPSLDYSGNTNRDFFYANSDIMVVPADNIRLEDIILSYETRRTHQDKKRFPQWRIFTGLSNLGPLWLANKDHIDPYYNNIPKQGIRFMLGSNFSF